MPVPAVSSASPQCSSGSPAEREGGREGREGGERERGEGEGGERGERGRGEREGRGRGGRKTEREFSLKFHNAVGQTPWPPTSSLFHHVFCSCGFLSGIVRHWTVSSSSESSCIDTMTP